MSPEPLPTSSHVIEYRPLEQLNAIRVVTLRQGSRGDPVECSIIHTELSERPYQALSYEWGPGINDGTISLDGCPVHIRRNLYEALVQIRSTTKDLYLWIDAFCINQADTQERNHQVTMMSKIYTKAENVIVWLGVAQDNSDIAMEKLVDDRLSDLIRYGSLGKIEQQAILTLCHRSYWLRVWILQELFLARSYVLWCGSKFISEERLGTGLATVGSFNRQYKYCKTISESPANSLRITKELRDTTLNSMGRWLRMCVHYNFKSGQPAI